MKYINIIIFLVITSLAHAENKLQQEQKKYIENGFNLIKQPNLESLLINQSFDIVFQNDIYPYFVNENGKYLIEVKNRNKVFSRKWEIKNNQFCVQSLRGGNLCITLLQKDNKYVGCSSREMGCYYKFQNFNSGDIKKLKNKF